MATFSTFIVMPIVFFIVTSIGIGVCMVLRFKYGYCVAGRRRVVAHPGQMMVVGPATVGGMHTHHVGNHFGHGHRHGRHHRHNNALRLTLSYGPGQHPQQMPVAMHPQPNQPHQPLQPGYNPNNMQQGPTAPFDAAYPPMSYPHPPNGPPQNGSHPGGPYLQPGAAQFGLPQPEPMTGAMAPPPYEEHYGYNHSPNPDKDSRKNSVVSTQHI